MKISFVIPCYGSEKTIDSVVAEIKNTVAPLCDEYEIIMVSDASPDRVFEKIDQLCREDPQHCRGFEFSMNFGQHAALMAGFKVASGDIVFSVDDDGQAPLESIPQMIESLKDMDVVFGRYEHKCHNIFRNFGSRINDFMAEKLLNKPKKLSVSSFFALRRFIVDEIINYSNAYPYILGLLLRSTKRIGNVTVVHRSRKIGRSGYTFRKLVSLWLNGFTAFSVVPLRIASFCGFLFSFIGFFCMCYCILNKLLHPQVPIGYSSIMTAIIFIGGVLMLILGMTGEYIGRIYICLNKSPQYVIRAYAGETNPNLSERKIGS